MRKQTNRRSAFLIATLCGCLATGFDVYAAPEQKAEQAQFDLLELRVKGNSLLEKVLLERTVYPFLGPKKSIETVEKAREALEKVYQAQGFQTVAVEIPEQDVKNGVVYLQVVEGRVSRLRVKDSRYFSLDKIKAGVPELAEGKVPNLPVMQKQLAKLGQESADRKITPVLRAGDTPGTLEVDLKVKDNLPLHGRLELNGRNTSSTSRLRLVSSLHYDNLWQKMHSASLMYQVAPEENKEVDVWAGTYMLPLPYTDAKLALYAVSSSSDAKVANVGDTTVIGIGEIYGLRFVKPLPGLTDYSHSLTLGVDYKDFKQDVLNAGPDPIKTPISYLPFMVQYGSSLSTKNSLTTFNLGVNFSVRGLGNQQSQFENRRNNSDADCGKTLAEINTIEGKPNPNPRGSNCISAQSNFTVLTGGLNFTHNLPLGMEIFSRFSGQVADSPLINNEQLSLGGMQSVRGYFETQALADDGMIGSVELRSPHLLPSYMDTVDKLQALAFVDGGQGWIIHGSPGEPKNYSLASAGLGMRFQLLQYFEGVFDLGFPLLNSDPVKKGDPKLHFSIATEF